MGLKLNSGNIRRVHGRWGAVGSGTIECKTNAYRVRTRIMYARHDLIAHFTSHNLNGILVNSISGVDWFGCINGKSRPWNRFTILVPLQWPRPVDLHQKDRRFTIQHKGIRRLPVKFYEVTVNILYNSQQSNFSNLHAATARTLRIQHRPPVTCISLVILEVEFLGCETITDCRNVIDLDNFCPVRSVIPSTNRIVCSLYQDHLNVAIRRIVRGLHGDTGNCRCAHTGSYHKTRRLTVAAVKIQVFGRFSINCVCRSFRPGAV